MKKKILDRTIISGLLFFSCISLSQNIFSQQDPADSGAYFKSFDGTNIYYEVRGNGQPVLLVHGFIVNGQSWKRTELYKDLLKQGYKVIILDQRGNGFSDKPHDSTAYDNDAEAKDIMGLMKHLTIKKYSAVGYSRGAIIVARLLILDKNISRAVMGGMGADFTDPQWPRRILFYRALSGDSIPELLGMVNNVKKQGLDQQALAYLQRSQPSTSKQELASVRQPVLIICGDKDADNGSAKGLADLFQRPTYKITPGDHGIASRTKEFSEEVIKFLKQKN
jgi:pimeloyl-ACP methyl ester carboxylesterase